jgi:hypothetical protein
MAEPSATLNTAHLAEALSVASDRLIPGKKYIIVAKVGGPGIVYTGTFEEIGSTTARPGVYVLRFNDVTRLDGVPFTGSLTEASHFYIPYSPEQLDQLTRRTREHEMNTFGHTVPGMRLPATLKGKILSYLGGRRRTRRHRNSRKRRATRRRHH